MLSILSATFVESPSCSHGRLSLNKKEGVEKEEEEEETLPKDTTKEEEEEEGRRRPTDFQKFN